MTTATKKRKSDTATSISLSSGGKSVTMTGDQWNAAVDNILSGGRNEPLIFEGMANREYICKVRPQCVFKEYGNYAEQKTQFAIELNVSPSDLLNSPLFNSAFHRDSRGIIDRVSQEVSQFKKHMLPVGWEFELKPFSAPRLPDADEEEDDIELEHDGDGEDEPDIPEYQSISGWRKFPPQKMAIVQIIPNSGQLAAIVIKAGNFEHHYAGEQWGDRLYLVRFLAPPKQTTIEDHAGPVDDPQTQLEDYAGTSAFDDLPVPFTRAQLESLAEGALINFSEPDGAVTSDTLCRTATGWQMSYGSEINSAAVYNAYSEHRLNILSYPGGLAALPDWAKPAAVPNMADSQPAKAKGKSRGAKA